MSFLNKKKLSFIKKPILWLVFLATSLLTNIIIYSFIQFELIDNGWIKHRYGNFTFIDTLNAGSAPIPYLLEFPDSLNMPSQDFVMNYKQKGNEIYYIYIVAGYSDSICYIDQHIYFDKFNSKTEEVTKNINMSNYLDIYQELITPINKQIIWLRNPNNKCYLN